MAQSGFTPIQLYFSTTAAATPSAGNLANGELAVNITDGRLFYKDNGGTVRVLAGTGGSGVVAGSNTQVQFNNNGVFGASANMVFNGTRLTVADLADSGLTSGRVTYASTGGALVDSANLTFDGTNLTLGGGTANGVAYLNGSKVLTTGSALTFDGTNLGVGSAATALGTYRGAEFAGTTATTGGFLRMRTSDSSINSLDFTDSNGRAIFTTTNHPVRFGVNDTEQMRLTSTGLGIGTSSPGAKLHSLSNIGGVSESLRLQNDFTFATSGRGTELTFRGTSGGLLASISGVASTSADDQGLIRYSANGATGFHAFLTNGTERMRLDSSGNLGLGVTPSAWGSNNRAYQVAPTGVAWTPALSYVGGEANFSHNCYHDGTSWRFAGTGFGATRLEAGIQGAFRWFSSGNVSGTANNAISFTQAMTLDASGNLLVGITSDNHHVFVKNAGNGTGTTNIFQVQNAGSDTVAIFLSGTSYGTSNSAGTSLRIGRSSSTSRSINAGGTINASGADYAEYMTKAGDFAVAKGDVVGINADGKLTNVFADAVSFVVKSTDPSYVGGDVWGNEESIGKRPAKDATDAEKAAYADALEAARQKVDRIAFAGQVPVNVTGAIPGQYIVPVNDNGAIKGIAKAEADMTLAEYMRAVGKVIAVKEDGRAFIIVKVA